MLHSESMQVEREYRNGAIPASNVAISLFFETPEQIYSRVFQEIRPKDQLPLIQVQYYRSVSINSSIRKVDQKILVKIADILQDAPSPITEALAHILLSKLFRKRIGQDYQLRYRQWMNRPEIREKVHELRKSRGRKIIHPSQGEHYNLEDLFDEINLKFFQGKLKKPLLGWSRTAARTRLGHFDPSHYAIVISRIMDHPDTPRILLEYIMYHEMLHIVHPVEVSGKRKKIHTRNFRVAEKLFPEFQETQKLLKGFLCTR